VEQGWFYAEGEGSFGPVSVDALTAALSRMPEPAQVLVWHSGFEDWRPVKDIPDLAKRFVARTPDVVKLDPRMDRWSADDPQAETWADDGLPAAPRRRWPYIAAIAVATALLAGGAIYASRTALTTSEPESRVVLPATSAPEQPKQAARPDPAAALAQVTETAVQAAAATEALAQKLWASIEPQGMQPPEYASASRSDLERHVRELRTAEANVTDAYNRYTALLKAERELIEETARTSNLEENSRTDFLKLVDDRQGAALELITRMLQARGDLYRAMQGVQAIAIDQFGKYKNTPEGIRFSTKAATDRFGAAVAEVNAVNRRLDLVEERILKARQAPAQPAWKDMMTK